MINYDAGIVLIDLHQLNVKQLQTMQISDTEYGAAYCQRRTRTREQQPTGIRFPNQMIEQININNQGKRGPGIFSAWVIEACRQRRLTSENIYIN